MRRQLLDSQFKRDKQTGESRLMEMRSRSLRLIKWPWSIVPAASVLFVLLACDPSNEAQQVDKDPEHTPGVSANEILLGSSSALGGHASFLGTQYSHGAIAWFNEVNAAGGVHGRHIRLISYDDEYDPPKTVANTEKLINDDEVFMLFNYNFLLVYYLPARNLNKLIMQCWQKSMLVRASP